MKEQNTWAIFIFILFQLSRKKNAFMNEQQTHDTGDCVIIVIMHRRTTNIASLSILSIKSVHRRAGHLKKKKKTRMEILFRVCVPFFLFAPISLSSFAWRPESRVDAATVAADSRVSEGVSLESTFSAGCWRPIFGGLNFLHLQLPSSFDTLFPATRAAAGNINVQAAETLSYSRDSRPMMMMMMERETNRWWVGRHL